MTELWQFFKQDYWDSFQKDVVENNIYKHIVFYNELQKESPFEDDINMALACLSAYMFHDNISEFKVWMDKEIPALNRNTPRDISQHENGMNWMREFILRS